MSYVLFVVFFGTAGPLALSSGFDTQKECEVARRDVAVQVKTNNADKDRPQILAYAAVCVKPQPVKPAGKSV